ncbi:1-(5-phosphoribosyl)-5-((5-phosphoribosylamino)methylideneamino)imidazole-4-carboxamide isomerase [Endozoicomonas sp. (ex Bugula neritina AB1)]|nr:1-(5-phosphoribosyl)-5-((5-phosphoribosylamino)methylideneamino)imidazole-4-carboxamide isomerase [Endozoicomonas sp. (ex Bugula neritina AB1)]
MDRTAPSEIKFRKKARLLELRFNEAVFSLESELLRVLSPSAEVKGHGNPVLQTGKKNVTITAIEPVGNYAIKLIFDDGHSTGIYDWGYLYDLCINKDRYWGEYLAEMHSANASRDPNASVVQLL